MLSRFYGRRCLYLHVLNGSSCSSLSCVDDPLQALVAKGMEAETARKKMDLAPSSAFSERSRGSASVTRRLHFCRYYAWLSSSGVVLLSEAQRDGRHLVANWHHLWMLGSIDFDIAHQPLLLKQLIRGTGLYNLSLLFPSALPKTGHLRASPSGLTPALHSLMISS